MFGRDSYLRKRLSTSGNQHALFCLEKTGICRKSLNRISMFSRDSYLRKCLSAIGNGEIKVLTGILGCGKSTLLELLRSSLLGQGISRDQIILLPLDRPGNAMYRNPIELSRLVHERFQKTGGRHFVLIDEIRYCESVRNPYLPDGEKVTFADTLNGFLHMPQTEVFVTCSGPDMLPLNLPTSLRGRCCHIPVEPLSLREYSEARGADPEYSLREYLLYGGLPGIAACSSAEENQQFLSEHLGKICRMAVRDNRLRESMLLQDILSWIAAAGGAPLSSAGLAGLLLRERGRRANGNTVGSYLRALQDSLLIRSSARYDIRRRRHVGSPFAYFFADTGLLCAASGFAAPQYGHLIETAVYGELIRRGYEVSAGILYDRKDSPYETGLVVRHIDEQAYITVRCGTGPVNGSGRKMAQLCRIPDSFPKIVIERDVFRSFTDELGIRHISPEDFLMDEHSVFS